MFTLSSRRTALIGSSSLVGQKKVHDALDCPDRNPPLFPLPANKRNFGFFKQPL